MESVFIFRELLEQPRHFLSPSQWELGAVLPAGGCTSLALPLLRWDPQLVSAHSDECGPFHRGWWVLHIHVGHSMMALKKKNQCLNACLSGVPGSAHLHHPVSREPHQSHAFGSTKTEEEGAFMCPKVTFLVWFAYRHRGSSHIFFLCLDCCHLKEIFGAENKGMFVVVPL